MKVLFSGGQTCHSETLKRLLIIADDIAFLDRPSITFKNWGTVAVKSGFRGLKPEKPIKLSFYEPPSGPVTELYNKYIEQDIKNIEFKKTLWEGFRNSEFFYRKFVNPIDNYKPFTGSDIIKAIANDETLINKKYEGDFRVEKLFKVDTQLGREITFRVLLTEASIKVTNSLLICEQNNILPVTDDYYFSKLLFLRTSSSHYLGDTHRLSSHLGYEVSKVVIPDELLQKLSFDEIFEYRRRTIDAYRAWDIEINRLSTFVEELNSDTYQDDIKMIIAKELKPKLVEYSNEIIEERDKLFGSMLKKILRWEVPALSIAFFSDVSLSSAVYYFLAGLSPSVPDVVDYYRSRRSSKRKNALTYLIGLSKKV